MLSGVFPCIWARTRCSDLRGVVGVVRALSKRGLQGTIYYSWSAFIAILIPVRPSPGRGIWLCHPMELIEQDAPLQPRLQFGQKFT
jgi:hypothetical protein